MNISAIAAMGKNRVIGKNNQLPWHLPADLQHFKQLTIGHPIIMGRKTFESIGKALPHRTNIIMSTNPHFHAANCLTATSIEEVMRLNEVSTSAEIFIIGGEHIFQLWLPYINRVYLTEVDCEISGDAFFPELDKNEWREVARESHQPDEKNPYFYDFVVLEKR
jgi:dihydrofolate reductase